MSNKENSLFDSLFIWIKFLVRTQIAINQCEGSSLNPSNGNPESTCDHCGGTGYMKSSPSCYHTCLECLGRGMKIKCD